MKSVFRAIGNALSGIIDGTARILKAIINGLCSHCTALHCTFSTRLLTKPLSQVSQTF